MPLFSKRIQFKAGFMTSKTYITFELGLAFKGSISPDCVINNTCLNVFLLNIVNKCLNNI